MSERRPAPVRSQPPVTLEPQAGYFLMSLVRDGPLVPVRIWLGRPIDPDTGLEMDRSPRWQCEINGEEADVDRAWPWCAKRPISPEEFAYRMARARHARTHEPDMAEAEPTRKPDLMRLPVPWAR